MAQHFSPFELVIHFFVGAIPGAVVGFILYAFHFRVEDIFLPQVRTAVIHYIGGGALITGLLFALFRPSLKHW